MSALIHIYGDYQMFSTTSKRFMQQKALESLDLAELAQSNPNDLVMEWKKEDYDAYEIQQVIEIMKAYTDIKQDIFIYDTVFQYSSEKIADTLALDEVYVQVTIKQMQKALVRAECSPDSWETAMYDYMCDHIRIHETQNKLGGFVSDENEIKRVQNILETFDEGEQEVFHYYFLFGYSISEICKLLCYDEAYINNCLMKYENALKDTDSKYWTKAAHALVWHKVVKARQQRFNKMSPSHVETSILKKAKEQQKSKMFRLPPKQKFVRIASIIFFFLITSVTTGYAMFRFGIIQIPHERSSDTYLITVDDGERKQHEVVETLYLPEYIPSGYRVIEQVGLINENNLIETIYSDTAYEIKFQQCVDYAMFDIDNENVQSEKIMIKNNEGIYQEKTLLKN